MKIIVILLTILMCNNLFSAFSSLTIGARYLGLGESYTALPFDSLGAFGNPASLARAKEIELSGGAFYLYEEKSLIQFYSSIILPMKYFISGYSFYRIGIKSIYNENIYYVSFAKRLNLFCIGINIKLLNVRFDSEMSEIEIKNNVYNISSDFGVHITPFRRFLIGFLVKDINKPVFYLFKDSPQIINRNGRFGVSYYFKDYLLLTSDLLFEENKSFDAGKNIFLGCEIILYRTLVIRLGRSNEITLGVGLNTAQFNINWALLVHKELGSTKQIDLTVRF